MNRKLVLNNALKSNQAYNTQVLRKNFDQNDITIDKNNQININTYTQIEADERFQLNLITFLPSDGDILTWDLNLGTVRWQAPQNFDVVSWLQNLPAFAQNLILTYDDVSEKFIWKDFLQNYYTKDQTFNKIEINGSFDAVSTEIQNINDNLSLNYYTGEFIDGLFIAQQQLIDEKQDRLLNYGPQDQQMLIYDAVNGIQWINQPTYDLSVFYTKSQTDALVDESLLTFYNDVIIVNYFDKNEVTTFLNNKQNDLLTYYNTPSTGQFLAFNGVDLEWVTNSIDLSNYYTKNQTDALVDESLLTFYNDVLLVDYFDNNQITAFLDNKQNDLIQTYSPVENDILTINNLGQIEFHNVYTKYLNNYVQVTSLNFLLSLYLLKTDAANWYQAKLNFTEHGQIIIWDGINEQIDYILLNEYSGFDNYYLKSAIDSTLLLYYTKNEMITILDNQYYQKSEVDYHISQAVDVKQDKLVDLVPSPTSGQVLSYNGSLVWIDPPQTDLSNYYDKPAVDGLLDGKQDALTPLVPDPTGYSYVLFWDSFDQQIKWTTNPGFLVTYQDFWDQLNQKLYISTYDAFLITNTAAINAKQDQLQFSQNGEIAIYDGSQIQYQVLKNYNQFTQYYLKSEIDTLISGKQDDLTNLYYLPNYVLTINGGVISWQDPSTLVSLQDYATQAWVSDQLSLYVLTASLNGILSSYALLADVYTVSFIDANFYLASQVDTLLTNYALTTTLSNYRLIADSYSQNQIDTMLLDYVKQSDLTTTLADYRLISDSYSQTQINDALALKQNDILSNYTHSANQVLAVNGTNDALIFVDQSGGGGTDVEAWLKSLAGYGTGLFLIYPAVNQPFEWKTAAQIQIVDYLYLTSQYYNASTCNGRFLQKNMVSSVSQYVNIQLPNNSSSGYYFIVSNPSNVYLKIFKNYFENNSDSFYLYNFSKTKAHMYISGNQCVFRNDNYYFQDASNNNFIYLTGGSTKYCYLYTQYLYMNSGSAYNSFTINLNESVRYANMYFRAYNTSDIIALRAYNGGSSGSINDLRLYINNNSNSGQYHTIFQRRFSNISYVHNQNGNYYVWSDKQVKQNIKKCGCQLHLFNKFADVWCQFEYINVDVEDSKNSQSYGVIAQEIDDLVKNHKIDALKNCINQNTDEKGVSTMSLCYEQLQNYCINQLYQKCKQQDVLISEQSKKIEDLEQRLQKLEQLLLQSN